MTTRGNCTTPAVNCQVSISSSNQVHVHMLIDIEFEMESGEGQLDSIVDRMSAQMMDAACQGIGTTLETVDQYNVNNLQKLEPDWRKHGKRPFRVLTPIGVVSFNRSRLLNKRNNKTCVPSVTWWKTKQNAHLSKTLLEKCERLALVMSFREAAEYIAKDANDRLLSASTIWSLLQTLCQSSETATQGMTDRFFAQHPELSRFVAKEKPNNPNDCFDAVENLSDSTIYLTEPNETFDSFPQKLSSGKTRVAQGSVLLQLDEVLTRAQRQKRKYNTLYTAVIENEFGEVEGLVASTPNQLIKRAIVVLHRMGVFTDKRLEVISDGAKWIADAIEPFNSIGCYHILCWYHLAKRVYQGVSAIGLAKPQRKALEYEILSKLWKGSVTEAIASLKPYCSTAKSQDRFETLIDYLRRKQALIPDYDKRKADHLWVASSRVERWNNTVVAERCKKSGRSWVPKGALAIATGKWRQTLGDYTISN